MTCMVKITFLKSFSFSLFTQICWRYVGVPVGDPSVFCVLYSVSVSSIVENPRSNSTPINNFVLAHFTSDTLSVLIFDFESLIRLRRASTSSLEVQEEV